MTYRPVFMLVVLASILTGCAQTQVYTYDRVKFAVFAVTDDAASRKEVEGVISGLFRRNGYDAVSSSQVVPGPIKAGDKAYREDFLEQGVAAALVLRPIEVGPGANIESAANYLQDEDYATIRDFVADYRGDDFTTRAVIEIGAFRLSLQQAGKIWQGVVWLDGAFESREAGIEQLAQLVLENVGQWRDQLRASAGLPPLD